MKIPFKNIAKSLRGFSVPFFGVSWEPPKSEREVVRKLLLYLEDRRALFYPYDLEIPHYVVESVLEIRRHLTELISEEASNSALLPHLQSMRAACRKFLDQNPERRTRGIRDMVELSQSLGELRAAFGIQIAQLSVKYGVDVDSQLEIILPVEDREK